MPESLGKSSQTDGLDYEENRLEFLVQRENILLVFPKNYSFVKNLGNKYVKRLKKHGWNVRNTVFIEIPYVMTFSYKLLPALVASYILDVVPQKSYFKCLVLTRDYLPNTHFIEIKDTVLHEKLHLTEEEPRFLQGIIDSGDPTLKKEERVHKEVSSEIIEQYGVLAQKSEERSVLFAHQLQSRSKTIVSGYLEYWLWRYLNENFEKYRKLAHTASHDMLKALGECNPKIERNIKQGYTKMFNYRVT